jgi:thioredoxin reductase/ferredoxin
MEATVIITIAASALLFLGLGAVLDDRRARRRREEPPPPELRLLHSLNDDRCIGCEACIDVCPTEVLDLVNHKVQISRFEDCVQCEQCANSCPTMALVMYREGSQPKMLTVPELDEKFQTGVPGQYLIGEVAGKPLVKNAANLGRAVIEHIRRDLAAQPAPAKDVLDVIIVGSGPSGLSAGLSCIKYQLSCLVLEKEHVISSTVSRYPKGKHFMAEPSNAVNLSFLPVFDSTKEELVAAWQKVVEGARLPIKLGEAVETVKRGDDGVFTVKTTVGTYKSRTVVLATGLRGKPRLLVVPGANLEKVHSLLDDPGEFGGMHVLVVGGGDSAVEGACSLADAGATVTLSYRGDGFKRCKQGNQKRLAEYEAAHKVTTHLESNVKEFTADKVTIKLKDGSSITIPNDHAFVLIGADTPVVWLEANNVRFIERPHLYALGSTEDVARRAAPDAVECARTTEGAIAALLGQPAKPSRKRLRSVVEHIRDDFKEVVNTTVGEVSRVFRVQDLDGYAPRDAARESHRGKARTPVRGVGRTTASSAALPGLIAPERLARNAVGRATASADAWKDPPTATNVAALRASDWSEPRTFVGPTPRGKDKTNPAFKAPRGQVSNSTLPYQAIGAKPERAKSAKKPFEATGSRAALNFDDVVETAFDKAFEPKTSPEAKSGATVVTAVPPAAPARTPTPGSMPRAKTVLKFDGTGANAAIPFEDAIDNALDSAFGEAPSSAAKTATGIAPPVAAVAPAAVPARADDDFDGEDPTTAMDAQKLA